MEKNKNNSIKDKISYETFLESWKNEGLSGKYNYLVTLVGHTPITSKLFINAIKNTSQLKRVYFIVTQETEKNLNEIVKDTDIEPNLFERKVIKSKHDTETIFSFIREISGKHDLRKIIVDITGGTKPMAGAAAMAASTFGMDVGYADYYEYDPVTRKPIQEKGQFVQLIENPLTRELELRKAKNYFNAGRFSIALEILKELEKRESNVGDIRAAIKVADSYRLWDEIKLNEAYEKLKEAINDKFLESTRIDIEQLKNNLEYFEENKGNFLTPAFLFSLGIFNENMYKFDIAVFLYYRTLEFILENILKNEYGIDPSNFNPVILKDDVKVKFYELSGYREGTNKIGLFKQAALILAFGNEIINSKDELGHIERICEYRNRTIYTHGREPITEREANDFRKFVEYKLKKFLRNNKKDIDEELQKLKFAKWN